MYMLFSAGFAALRELSSKWALAKSLGLAETDGDDDDGHDDNLDDSRDGAVARTRRRRRVARPRHKVSTRARCCCSPLLSFHNVLLSGVCWHPRYRLIVRKIWRMTSAGTTSLIGRIPPPRIARQDQHHRPHYFCFRCSPDLPFF